MRRKAVDGGLRLELSRPVEGDLAAALARLRSWLSAIEQSPDGKVVVLRFASDMAAEIGRPEPGMLVIDLKRQAGASGHAAASAPPIPQPRPARVTASMPGPPVRPTAERPAAEPEALPGLVDSTALPRFRPAEHDGVIELEAIWPEPVPAAAFRRAGRLWMVFGRPAPGLSLTSVSEALPRLASLRVFPHPEALVLTLDDGAFELSMDRRGAAWTVRLGGAESPPQSAVAWPPVAGKLQIPEAASLVALDDPVVGDRLDVALLLAPGLGEPVGRQAVGLELLPSVQGVIWRAHADGIEAVAHAQGVTIALPHAFVQMAPVMDVGGSGETPPPAPPGHGADNPVDHALSEPQAEPPAPDRLEVVPADAKKPRTDRLLDLVAGTLAPGRTARDERRRLEAAILQSAGPAQVDRRLDLARMLLAQELAAEAVGSLAAVGAEGAAKPAAAGLSGIAALMRGQLDVAGRELGRPELDGDPEVALWRAVLAAAHCDWPTAMREWRRSGGVPAGYSDALRVRLGIVGSRIELADGRSDAALAILDRLHDLPKSPEAGARIRLAQALALDAQKDRQAAAAALADAKAAGDRDTRLEAERTQIAWGLREGAISPESALSRLEAMRPMWRGHPNEVAFLDDLGRLREARGGLPAAIAAWQEAIGEAGDPRSADRIRRGLQERVARSLLGQGDGPPMSPLTALALYRQHAELLPRGAALAEVERRLAARLARAGIEETAAVLLHQRLDLGGSAEARAEAGAALADAHLVDNDAESALRMLRSTGPEAGLPVALASQRQTLRLRALAMVSPDGPSGTEAEEWAAGLRSAWHDQDWHRIETASAALLAGPSPPGVDRADAILALALARARRGDAEGLSAIDSAYAAELAGTRGRALLAMLAAGALPARGADLAPVEAGIEAVRNYLGGAAGAS